ncbi:hypothetical protein BU24DRAFT_260702 [Aaosphaeria arxii CBS 175.79]|uniref:Uncharacterized protein n=1 Tax=Aaosphaeria arxii CBS 175.79 TaxID=1450172 RepID=A0A6A5XI13_9PLEO|nr:uncharacterized protein BU24DRAFT_260702 [Aaosphaeria arxii CBS 175.79]KAF2012878.1 hypothetical protein BU24DRAFT_260702 [Aaosphaeria arxii CBS 175.79]
MTSGAPTPSSILYPPCLNSIIRIILEITYIFARVCLPGNRDEARSSNIQHPTTCHVALPPNLAQIQRSSSPRVPIRTCSDINIICLVLLLYQPLPTDSQRLDTRHVPGSHCRRLSTLPHLSTYRASQVFPYPSRSTYDVAFPNDMFTVVQSYYCAHAFQDHLEQGH